MAGVLFVKDHIGARGEAIFYVLMTRFCGRNQPFFKPQFLGDKFATIDYLVELVDAGTLTSFFFVQVKTTTQGYTGKQQKYLRATVSQQDMQRLALYPAPTYIVGIDEREERGFIISANEQHVTGLSGIPTMFELNCTHLSSLWDEVYTFWRQRDMRLRDSFFAYKREGENL